MNPVEIAELDALNLLVVVDNESDTLSSVDRGVPQLPELGRLVARVPHLAPKDGHDCVEPWGHLCLACHGFSALVTGRRGSEERSVLFDVGPSAEVWLENARRLGVRLASIEAVCLSHWHADHSGGLPGVVAAITRSRLDEGLPPPIVDLHPDRPDQRGTMTPAGTLVLLNPEPTFEAIESAGGRVTKHAEAHVLAGFFFVSGEIERVTSYEAGFVGHHTVRDGHTVPDPLILDERFLAARVRGRGVSVLSPCSHAGVVNAAPGALDAADRRHPRRLSSGRRGHGAADRADRPRPRQSCQASCRRAGALYRLACQGGARAYVCAGKLRAERRRLALRSARDVSEKVPGQELRRGQIATGGLEEFQDSLVFE